MTIAWILRAIFVGLLPVVLADSAFPAGKCTNKACDLSPYNIDWSTPIDSSPFCFNISSAQTCRPDSYGCCTLFSQRFIKLLITTYPACITKKLIVTVDGVRKGGGVYFDNLSSQTAQLRITTLGLNSTIVSSQGVVAVCLTLPPPCQTVDTFCGPNCRYAIFDPYVHNCCPTCDFPFRSTPIDESPFPPPPSPPSPSPPSPSPSPPPPPSPSPPPPSPPSPPPPLNPDDPPPPPTVFLYGTCKCTQCTQCECIN